MKKLLLTTTFLFLSLVGGREAAAIETTRYKFYGPQSSRSYINDEVYGLEITEDRRELRFTFAGHSLHGDWWSCHSVTDEEFDQIAEAEENTLSTAVIEVLSCNADEKQKIKIIFYEKNPHYDTERIELRTHTFTEFYSRNDNSRQTIGPMRR